jgi:hypothetical protein
MAIRNIYIRARDSIKDSFKKGIRTAFFSKKVHKKARNLAIFIQNERFQIYVPASVGIPLWMVSKVFLILFLRILFNKYL